MRKILIKLIFFLSSFVSQNIFVFVLVLGMLSQMMVILYEALKIIDKWLNLFIFFYECRLKSRLINPLWEFPFINKKDTFCRVLNWKIVTSVRYFGADNPP